MTSHKASQRKYVKLLIYKKNVDEYEKAVTKFLEIHKSPSLVDKKKLENKIQKGILERLDKANSCVELKKEFEK